MEPARDRAPAPASPIRVVVFTSGPFLDAGARQFIARLEGHPEIQLLAVLHECAGSSLRDVLGDAWRRRGLLAPAVLLIQASRAVVRRLARPALETRIRHGLASLAGRTHRVADLHAPEVLETTRRLAPQLGLIYGGPILKPDLFQIPAFGTLGIHHGKLPEYRGKKTTFWAMFNGEGSAGVTIQRVNAGLDTGEVVKEGAVPIGRRPLWVVWNRLEALGIELYVQAILEVRRGTAAFRPTTGRRRALYRDPQLPDILRFWSRYLVRLIRGV